VKAGTNLIMIIVKWAHQELHIHTSRFQVCLLC